MIQQFVLKKCRHWWGRACYFKRHGHFGGGSVHKEWVFLFWTQAEEDNLHPRPLAEPHCVPAVVGNIEYESTRVPPWWGLLGIASMWKWAKGQAEVLGGSVWSSGCLLVKVGQTSLCPNSHTCSPFKTSQLHLLKERSMPPLHLFGPVSLLSGPHICCHLAELVRVFFPHFTPHHHCLTSNATSSLEFLIVISIHSLSPATATNSNPEVFNLEAPFVCGSSHH